jgi:hypothetical protein
MLDYAPPPQRLSQRWRRWLGPGEDTFLGSSALTLAVIAAALLLTLPFAPGFVCLGVPIAAAALPLAIGGLFQRRASKAFPLTAILIVLLYLFIMAVLLAA